MGLWAYFRSDFYNSLQNMHKHSKQKEGPTRVSDWGCCPGKTMIDCTD